MMSASPSVDQLSGALRVVGDLVTGVRPEQWSAPTPCTDWNVHQLVNHLVAASLLSGQALPERGLDHLGDDPAGAYRASGATLQAAFDQPGILERSFRGSLGTATGEEFLQIRLYDLLAHGWDLAQATGQPAVLPEDLAEQALTFARAQLSTQPRTGRFGPAQPIAEDAPAIDRLVAFLGRPTSAADSLRLGSLDAGGRWSW
jgi:uncharacterized protein (TIGR03086 family)